MTIISNSNTVAIMRFIEKSPSLSPGSGRMLAIILKGALTGFTLGLILAVLAGSWVWLEMRVNTGLLIPAATFLCLVFSFWTRKDFPYSLFLMGQVLLLFVLLAIYGFDRGALCAVPVYLFREGFHGSDLTQGTAGSLLEGILLSGNLLWIVFRRSTNDYLKKSKRGNIL